ncbi:MAG: hypothetical protein JKY61_06590 [Planctomycetes bacterium]|nr:hypothetical protein [Planctomycetota bacterium]
MSLKKSLLLLSLVCISAIQPAWASAQENKKHPVVKMHLKAKDAKAKKAFLKKVPAIEVGGELHLTGEVASEGGVKEGRPMYFYRVVLPRKARLAKVLARAPYEFTEGGKRKAIKKYSKYVAKIPWDFLQNPDGTGFKNSKVYDLGLFSLCRDLDRRRKDVVKLRNKLKKLKQPLSPEKWNKTRNQLLLKWESLVFYVESSELFNPMGAALRAELEKAVSHIRNKEKDDRTLADLKSAEDAKVEVVEIEISEKLIFHKIESNHLRFIYLTGEEGISDEKAKELAVLGEKTIELFRAVAIDPFPEFVAEQDGEVPIIPNGVFQEFFIGPDDGELQKELYEAHYNKTASNDDVWDMTATGSTLQRDKKAPLFLIFMKNQLGGLRGMVVHQLGHGLASMHYNRSDALNVKPALPVIRETVSRYLSFEKLGVNNMRCTNFAKATYKDQAIGDEKTRVLEGDSFQKRFFKLSLRAPTMEACAIVPLNRLNQLHMAKGWVTYYYILNYDGLLGQQWLRKCHDAVTKKGTGDRTGLDRNLWRDFTKEIATGIELPQDPLHLYEAGTKQIAEDALDVKD